MQLTFADSEFNHKRRKTRKEKFLARMEQLMPWEMLLQKIEPFYPKAGNGRRPYPLQSMLRIHLMQLWYNLSDPAMEDALYEIASMRQFAGLTLDRPVPDESTIMNFRHLLEQHDLGRQLFDTVNQWLIDSGILLTQGTLVDASIIEAPSSTKNQSHQRDPEAHQTKKGNQWHFGFKLHVGADVRTGICHSATCTGANQHDLNEAANLLHGEEEFVIGDSGYTGADKRDELPKDVQWHVADKPSIVKRWRRTPRLNKQKLDWAKAKSSARAKVEHIFRAVKQQFGYGKVRYKGIAKNENRLLMLLLSNNMLRVGQLAGIKG